MMSVPTPLVNWYNQGLRKPKEDNPRSTRCLLISAMSPAQTGAAALVPETLAQ
eukprot:CAMPEP_0178843374 /NCGR_PEP_ID=MMETSP0746-20121128/16112_1 /TAXON_ID=913974 /ORGANISM="Nitzschia punctata, Strain CCMP561" /LENGTH=52 /DNA_ID=CAMNT_0020506983 /DNA_START=181 /DNA_END=336 /DNA_ORIENTATION=+